jgi:hypothetical protein
MIILILFIAFIYRKMTTAENSKKKDGFDPSFLIYRFIFAFVLKPLTHVSFNVIVAGAQGLPSSQIVTMPEFSSL